MKVLKQQFTQWFNKTHGRRGTLWEDRFRSVLVQSESHVLRAMALLILIQIPCVQGFVMIRKITVGMYMEKLWDLRKRKKHTKL